MLLYSDGEGDPRKVPVINRPEYTVYYEYLPHQRDRTHWLHCDVHKWTPRVARQIDKDFDALLDLLGHEVRVIVAPYNAKLQHFVDFLGFEEGCKVQTNDGRIQRQYVAYPGRKMKRKRKAGG